MVRVPRRTALLLPLWLAACEDYDRTAPPPVSRDFAPLRYAYLPPINLNVQRVEIGEDFYPSRASGEIIDSSPINVPDTLYAMARDRLRPVAASGVATFQILTASIIRRGNQLNGTLEIRVNVRNGSDTNTGFAEARVTAAHSGAIPDQRAAVYDMMTTMMESMNVELEYQLRNKLRAWIVDPPAPGQPPPAAPPAQPAPPPEPPREAAPVEVPSDQTL